MLTLNVCGLKSYGQIDQVHNLLLRYEISVAVLTETEISHDLHLVTQPLGGRAVLHDGLEDEGRHRGVDDVGGDAALGEPGLLVVTRENRFSQLPTILDHRPISASSTATCTVRSCGCIKKCSSIICTCR